MVWYQNLYVGESIAHKQETIKQKICDNKRQTDIFVLALAANQRNLLEIIPSRDLLQKAYPKDRLFIVGLAHGYEEARDLALAIILEIYKKTGAFQVRAFLCQAQESLVSENPISMGGTLP